MKPPNAIEGPGLLTVVFVTIPLLFLLAPFMITEADNHFGTRAISTKNVSGWVTCCENSTRLVVQETKPVRTIINPRFGPTNIPAASTIHTFWDPKLNFGIKVGNHVSIRATCVSKQVLPIDTNNICTIQEATKISN